MFRPQINYCYYIKMYITISIVKALQHVRTKSLNILKASEIHYKQELVKITSNINNELFCRVGFFSGKVALDMVIINWKVLTIE